MDQESDQAYDQDLREQTYNAMAQRDTEELAEIWRENNLEEFTQLDMDVVRQILLERLGKLPEQLG